MNMIYHYAQLHDCHIILSGYYRKDCIKDQKVLQIIKNIKTLHRPLVHMHAFTRDKSSLLVLHDTNILKKSLRSFERLT